MGVAFDLVFGFLLESVRVHVGIKIKARSDKIKSHPHPNPTPVKGEGLQRPSGRNSGLGTARSHTCSK